MLFLTSPSVPPQLRGWQPVRKQAEWSRSSAWLMVSETGRELVVEIFDLDWAASEAWFSRFSPPGIRHPHLLPLESLQRSPEFCVAYYPPPATEATLRDHLRQNTLDHGGLLRCLQQCAAGLDHLANNGHCHRNVKPEHIAWDGRHAQLLRVGFPDEIELGGPEAAAGYLAPERVNGGEAQPAGDQFALALCYVEACTGHNPLIPNHVQILCGMQPVPLAGLSDAEQTVLSRALDADPAQRWPSCMELVVQLAEAVGIPLEALPQPIAAAEAPPDEHGEPMSVQTYRSLFVGCDAPTAEQVDAFVDYVSTQHSWYKHLPLTPPGSTFVFFLDPGAGMQQREDAAGRISYFDISRREQLFHHAMRYTDDYRRAFGCLSYATQNAPSFSLYGTDGSSSRFEHLPGLVVNGRLARLPIEAAEAASVEVTGIIHHIARDAWWWQDYLLSGPDSDSWARVRFPERYGAGAVEHDWPEASGGRAVLQAIITVLQRNHGNDPDRCIESFIAPERQRQLEAMRQACRRVVRLVYGHDPQ
jgi:hypothetical protein